jgi:hypothetical protein
MRRVTLPFWMENIEAVTWEPGEEWCAIKYFNPRSGKNHTRKVWLDEMESMRPNFRRFLACAVALSEHTPKRHQRTARQIRKWHEELQGRSTESSYLLYGYGMWKWSDLASVKLSQWREDPLSGKRIRYLHLGAAAGYDASMDYTLMEANCPGFTAISDVLCEHQQASHLEIFRMTCQMLQRFTNEVLEANAASFLGQVRTCAAVTMPLASILDLLSGSVDSRSTSEITFPQLDMGQPW